MRTLAGKLALLRREPRRMAAPVAAAALRWAEPGEVDALATVALSLPTPPAVAAVIAVLHRLRPETADRLARPAIPVDAAMRLLRSRQELLNGIAVARRRADPRLLDRLAAFLDGPDDEVPRRAAAAILDIVTTHAGRHGRRRMDDRTAALIDGAVTAAVSGGNRRPDAVCLAAAVLAARPGPRLERLLADPHHPVQFSIRRAAGRADDPLARHNLFRWLTTDPLRGQAARTLHRVRGHAELLESAHLLLQPFRRRALRRVERPAACLPDAKTAATLPAGAQLDLVRYVRVLPLAGPVRRQRLSDCCGLPAPAARLHALLGLLGDDGDEAARLVESMCDDADEAVACLAAARVLHAGPIADPAVLRALESSRHRRIAARATAVAAGAGVEAFFERWLRLENAPRAAVAHRLIRTDRVSLVGGLRRRLGRGDRGERLAAIALADRLGATAELEQTLIGQVAGDDPRVVSAAVGALARGSSRQVIHVLRDAVDHPDVRVQANALEALTRIDRGAIDRLCDRLDSRDNRLRGNAVRAALRRPGRNGAGRPDGAGALRVMLGDADPRHRVSAIWVARRSREGRVSGDLRRIADQDALAEVRRRAAAAAAWIR